MTKHITGRESAYYVQSSLGVWLRWLLATLSGFALGVCGWLSFTFSTVDETNYILSLSFTATLQGVVIGVLQWDVLRHKIRRASWWIPATAIGWGVGVPAATLTLSTGLLIGRPAVIVTGVIVGTVMGVAQWLVLRGKIQRAILWIPANIITWVLSNGISSIHLLLIGGGVSIALFTAIINGTVLVWLLRQSDQSRSD